MSPGQGVACRQSQAVLACYTCRKRKIKCGRELPHCTICQETSQHCTYPSKAVRPGPKIGTVHGRTQKQRATGTDFGRSPAQLNDGTQQHDSEPVEPSTGNGVRSHSPASQLPSQSPAGTTDMLRLAYIIHPLFENCSPDQSNTVELLQETNGRERYLDALTISCDSLGLTLVQLNRLLPRYFEVYSAFQLFRLPNLETELRRIPTTSQRTALLASLLAFGLKGLEHHDINDLAQDQVLTEAMGNPSIHFRELSIKYMDLAIIELGDDPVTLPLLQAMILNTHCFLVQGVRGRAWRYLGTCIRCAYELNMHLIDADKAHAQEDQSVNAEQWCIKEEWRRAWWAIWEMDVFASFIRRCPTGIDWSQNETFLPAEDEKWYKGEPQPSCVLEFHLVQRSKSLVATKNQSPKAWFIVINSLMKDAQDISSPTSIDEFPVSDHTPVLENAKVGANQQQKAKKQIVDANRLQTILNCLHCTTTALPNRLRYFGQQLHFRRRDGIHHGSQVLADSSVYEICLMDQLTRMMVLKYHIFRTGFKWQAMRDSMAADDTVVAMTSSMELQYLTQYFEAADSVVKILRCSSADHYKHVNPFLASTAWLAGAIQLLHRSLLPNDSSDRDLPDSNFEVVSLTYQKAVDYWNMSEVPLRNWETLASGLEKSKESPYPDGQYHYDIPGTFTGGYSKPSPRHATRTRQRLFSQSQPSIAGEGTALDQTFPSHNNKQGNSPGDTFRIPASITQPPPPLPERMLTDNDNVSKHVPWPTQESDILPPSSDAEYDQVSFDYAQLHSTLSSNILESIPFETDRTMNMDFSNYLDELFSGSYMP